MIIRDKQLRNFYGEKTDNSIVPIILPAEANRANVRMIRSADEVLRDIHENSRQ
jgi:hypothetical protein